MKLKKSAHRINVGITVSPTAHKLGMLFARKKGSSFSAVVDKQLLKIKLNKI